MIWFVLGPSGVGKSDFGRYLADKRNWYRLEIDQFDKDGIDIHGLRQEWDSYFYDCNPVDLIKELTARTRKAGKSHCVLTFPGNLILNQKHISAAIGSIKIVYLYGSAAHCIAEFLNREQGQPRNLRIEHWINNNRTSYYEMGKPEFSANRVHVWLYSGEHRQHQDIYAEILDWD